MTEPKAGDKTIRQWAKAAAGHFWRHLPLWGWRGFAVGTLLTLYVSVMARGVANSFTEFGAKLSKTPLLGSLARYEETKNLQVAHPFAVLFLIVVFASWELVLRAACGDDRVFARFGKPDVARRITYCVAAGVLAADCWFYYAGITNSGWNGATFSFAALLATVGFVAVNVAVSLFAVFLTPKKEADRAPDPA